MFVPLPFQAGVTVTIILLSVASTSLPIDLTSTFFKIHYLFPPHAVFSTMIVIFGQGATGATTLKYSLPTLAAWILIAKGFAILGLRKRALLGNSSTPVVGGH